MPFSTAIDNLILDHFTGKATWTAPAAIWAGLSSTTPTKAGANVTEPSGGDYGRIQVEASEWASASGSATSNNAEQSFTVASADWVAGANLTHAVFYTASVAGTFLGFKALTTPKPILSGDTAKFPTGDLDLAVGGT